MIFFLPSCFYFQAWSEVSEGVGEKYQKQEVFSLAWREISLLLAGLFLYQRQMDTDQSILGFVHEGDGHSWSLIFIYLLSLLAPHSVMAVTEALDLDAGRRCSGSRPHRLGCSTDWGHSDEEFARSSSPTAALDVLSRLLEPEWCVWCNCPTRAKELCESHQPGSLSIPPLWHWLLYLPCPFPAETGSASVSVHRALGPSVWISASAYCHSRRVIASEAKSITCCK